jgi:dipeptidyl aminopeptidase/acylaminoacyl peptidase
MSFHDIVEDCRRALKFLAARPDVDPARIALIGHSEGALSGSLLAAQERVAALVLMASPGRALQELLREQLLAARRDAGATAAELEAFEKEYASFLSAIAQDAPIDAAKLSPELAQFAAERAWTKSHVGRDPLAAIVKVSCPILVLQGAKDVQVSAERDAPKLLAALDATGHADHELRLFAELDHLFKRAGDPPSELDYLKARPVDAEFLDVLSAWLRKRLAER